MEDIVFKTDFETEVLMQLTAIRRDLAEMKKKQDEMHAYLHSQMNKNLSTNILVSKIDFREKYNLTLPIANLEDFQKFDYDLKVNSNLKSDVCSELITYIDSNFSISKSFVRMLKAFITKDVALHFTAVRKARNPQQDDKKELKFKDTEMCNCMNSVIFGARSSKGILTTQKDLITALSGVLCNTKKWEK